MFSHEEEVAIERLCGLLIRREACRRVLSLLARGCRRKEVAAALGISAHTVDWHLKSTFALTGVTSTVEFVRLGEEALRRLEVQAHPPDPVGGTSGCLE